MICPCLAKGTQCGFAYVRAEPPVAIRCIDCAGVPHEICGVFHGRVQETQSAHTKAMLGVGPLSLVSLVFSVCLLKPSMKEFGCAFGFLRFLKLFLLHSTSEADNCVRENKNNSLLKWASYTTCTAKFDLCAALFSRVGHTHGTLGDLDWSLQASFFCSARPAVLGGPLCWDQLFGLLATAMRYCDILADEKDLVENLGRKICSVCSYHQLWSSARLTQCSDLNWCPVPTEVLQLATMKFEETLHVLAQEAGLYVTPDWYPLLGGKGLPDQSRVHWFRAGLEILVCWQHGKWVEIWLPHTATQIHLLRWIHTGLLRFESAPVVFSGGLKEDNSGLHSFIAMRRHSEGHNRWNRIHLTCVCFAWFTFRQSWPSRFSGLPQNLEVAAKGRGAQLENDPHDVIILTKRFASDDYLIQEPTLAFPRRYLNLMDEFPRTPRPLRPVKPAKRQHYLALCDILLEQAVTESTRRSVEFLVSCHTFVCSWLLSFDFCLAPSRLIYAMAPNQLRYQNYHGLKLFLGSFWDCMCAVLHSLLAWWQPPVVHCQLPGSHIQQHQCGAALFGGKVGANHALCGHT